MPIDIATAVKIAKDLFDFSKDLRGAYQRKEVKPDEVADRLLQIQEIALQLQQALSDARDENSKLQTRIADLSRMADFGKAFKTAYGVYWHEAYPYCPVCWDVEKKPVRLSGPIRIPGGGPFEQWTCPFHKQPISISWNALPEMKNQTATSTL